MTNALWHIDHCDLPLGRVVDVGAYLGVFSLGAVKKGAWDVYAFEANRDNFDRLCRNVKGHPEVKPFHVAVVGSMDKEYFTRGFGATSSLTTTPMAGMNAQSYNCIRFVDLVTMLAPLDFAKIDIEGMEHAIFDGSDEVEKVLKHIGFLQLEIHKTGPGWEGLLDDGAYLQRVKHLCGFLMEVGFTDQACECRRKHPGDFCSHNERYTGI